MAHRADLFSWKRRTTNSEVTRKAKKKSAISKWVEKIERETEENILDEDFHPLVDDEAVYEAHNLLESWIKELPNESQLQFNNEPWFQTTQRLDRKPTGLLQPLCEKYLPEEDIEQEEISFDEDYTRDFVKNNLLDTDEVDEIVQNLLSKDVKIRVESAAKKAKDPLKSMAERHKQVKVRSEKRAKQHQQRVKQAFTEDQVKVQAREEVIEEENRLLKWKREEEKKIQAQMKKIKIELEEEKEERQKAFEKQQEILRVAKEEMQKELQLKKEADMLEKRRRKEIEEKMKVQLRREMEEKHIEEMKSNMKLLHTFFCAWYSVVQEKRVREVKTRCKYEWKLMLKTWNGWRGFVKKVQTCRQLQAIEEHNKQKYRKEQMSVGHYRRRQLKRCFLAWRRFTRHQATKKQLMAEQQNKREKIEYFLQQATKNCLQEEKEEKRMLSENCVQKNGKRMSKNCLQENEEKIDKTDTAKEIDDTRLKEWFDNEIKKALNKKEVPLNNSRQPKKRGAELNLHNQAKLMLERQREERKLYKEKEKINEVKTIVKEEQLEQSQPIDEAINGPSSARFFKSKPYKPPATQPILLAMEERDKKRKERRAKIEADKRQKEEKKLKELRRLQEEREAAEQWEKEERIRLKKEEKRVQAQGALEKKQLAEESRRKHRLALHHYHRTLVKKYGVCAFKWMIEIQRNHEATSKYHRKKHLLKVCLLEWHNYTQTEMAGRNEVARLSYERLLLKRSMNSWLKCRFYLQNLNKMARVHSLGRIKRRALGAWQDHVTDEHIVMWAKESTADGHNLLRLTRGYFNSWKQFVVTQKHEREREKGRQLLRRKVQTWLPDYKGKHVSP